MVIKNSNKKFQVITIKNTNLNVFILAEFIFSIALAIIVNAHKVKIPVLRTGTKSEATIAATKKFFLLMSLNTNPATKPAIVHLDKQVTTVPKGANWKNNA